MTIELRIPSAGESITEVTIGEWLKSEGNAVKRDEVLVTIETDKASMELPAPEGGILEKILKGAGESAQVGEVIGLLDVSGEGESTTAESTAVKGSGKKSPERSAEDERETKKQRAEKHVGMRTAEELEARRVAGPSADALVLPAARRLLKKHGLSPGDVEATGPGGRLLKEDVLREVSERRDTQPSRAEPTKSAAGEARSRDHREEAVPMSSLRKAIAGRLVRATQEAALLTTFNEVDMSAVVHFRKTHGEEFLRRHEVKLGFMSFFIKATIEALKAIPGLNARIRDEEIIYRNYYDIGVAVGGGRGLVVPVLRNAERMSFAVIEAAIADLARRARDNSLRPDDLQGGTFTISNGGVYGSLLSTPIVNPPQSGVLGMHKIEDRPVAVAGKVVIRPMMYIALTYDHRIVDGREAVTFLRTIKEKIEDPTRILLEI